MFRRMLARIVRFFRHPAPGVVAAGDLAMTGLIITLTWPGTITPAFVISSSLLLGWCAAKMVAFWNVALVPA